jgi:lipopolysaccharide export system permease protein
MLKKPELAAHEIRDYQRLHPGLKREYWVVLETQLQARMAAPWTCLVVTLIAVPFGTPSGRRNIFYGVAGSIGLAFGFFIIQRVGFAIGQRGVLPPWFAAWLPNLFFGLLGLGLTARVR